MLSYDFMRRSLLAGAMLAVIIPMIGVITVNKKTSMLGDALSHSSLAGIAIGLIIGMEPLLTSLFICLLFSFILEMIRKKFPDYGDMATAVVMSAGIGLASVLSDFTPGGKSLDSFMFGSLSLISTSDLGLIGIIFVMVVISSLVLYWRLLFYSIDPTMARLSGIKVGLVNTIFTFMTSVTIAISVKLIGALMVTSLMVIPVASAMTISKSYKTLYLESILLSLAYVLVGLSISFHYGIKTGGSIVLTSLAGMFVVNIISFAKNKIRKNMFIK